MTLLQRTVLAKRCFGECGRIGGEPDMIGRCPLDDECIIDFTT